MSIQDDLLINWNEAARKLSKKREAQRNAEREAFDAAQEHSKAKRAYLKFMEDQQGLPKEDREVE